MNHPLQMILLSRDLILIHWFLDVALSGSRVVKTVSRDNRDFVQVIHRLVAQKFRSFALKSLFVNSRQKKIGDWNAVEAPETENYIRTKCL